MVPRSGRKSICSAQNARKRPQLWTWFNEGAVFYVCGDASRMAKDVDQALRTIAQQEGSMSEDDAGVWVKGLQKERALPKGCLLRFNIYHEDNEVKDLLLTTVFYG